MEILENNFKEAEEKSQYLEDNCEGSLFPSVSPSWVGVNTLWHVFKKRKKKQTRTKLKDFVVSSYKTKYVFPHADI